MKREEKKFLSQVFKNMDTREKVGESPAQLASLKQGIISVSLLALTLLLLSGCITSRNETARSTYYDSWRSCASDCPPENSRCIDSCTARFNSTH